MATRCWRYGIGCQGLKEQKRWREGGKVEKHPGGNTKAQERSRRQDRLKKKKKTEAKRETT